MEGKEALQIATPSAAPTVKSLEKCIICQKINDNKGDTKLTSTVKGRNVIVECSTISKDDLLDGIEDYEKIKYHVNSYYARYVSSKKRAEKRKTLSQEPNSADTGKLIEPLSPTTRPKKRKSNDAENIPSSSPRDKPCIVCNQMKSKGETKRYRICESRRASRFLAAIKFNKDIVYTRCSYMETITRVFAADVMYHDNCL